MSVEKIFRGELGTMKNLDKKTRESVAYTLENFRLGHEEQRLRSDAILRNNDWKLETQDYISTHSSKTSEGKLNNAFYRRVKFKFDVIVPYAAYREIMDYYLYSIENNVVEDVDFIRTNLDSIMTFCHLIAYYNGRYISYLHTKKSKTPLAVKLISAFIGREYTKIISFLEKIDVITMDRMYIPAIWDKKGKMHRKGVCRHYEFSVERDQQFCVHQVSSRRIISRVYACDVRFDEIEYVNEHANTVKDKALNDWFSKHFELGPDAFANREKDYEGFNYYNSRISQGDKKFERFTIGRDKFGSRLYHPFLNMNKDLRKFISIDGSVNTSVIDINNSHPYFFSLLFNSTFLDYVSHILLDEEINVFKSMSADPAFQEKIQLFSQIAASGNYYNFLRENIKTDRNLKELNMYYFYGKLNKRNAIYRFFEKDFNFVNIVKHKLIKISGYKRLCQILQRVEAYIMIDHVFNQLRDMDFKVIPLHDAMMCRVEDASAVRATIVNVFDKIGILPPVFDKTATLVGIQQAIEAVRKKNFNLFINKGIIYEQLNQIIKGVGIRNRVFHDQVKQPAIEYIDQRFESMRHLISDDLAEKYYELRMAMDSQDFGRFDFTSVYQQYKDADLMKKKFYSRDVFGYMKINPIEFINHLHGTEYKTRLKESNYIY